MERPNVRAADAVARDWEFVCISCGRVAFSMASASKALYCRHCESELVPVWFPINVPRYAVPVRKSVACPHCWESLVISMPPGKVPFGTTLFTCRHCLGEVAVNFRKHPIAVRKARRGK